MSNCLTQRSWRHRLARVVAPLSALALAVIIGGCGNEAEHMSDGPPSPTTTPTEPSRPAYEPDSVTQPPVVPHDAPASEPAATTTDEPADATSDAPVVTPIKPTLDAPDATAPSDTPKAEVETPEKAEEPKS